MTSPVSTEMHSTIKTRLRDIAKDEGVTILLAIESGSRAWGFHSPDSDYDVRFLYCQPVDRHLTVRPVRDVIERPISDELDLSGWDLRKVLGLILGSNAVALEWLQSPITYEEIPGFRKELTSFARQTLQRRPVMWHYRRLAERQMDRSANSDGSMRLKRYFYMIRPILALRWLRLHPGQAVPPMDMAALMAGSDLDRHVTRVIQGLIAEKTGLTEAGTIRQTPSEIDRLTEGELALAMAELARPAGPLEAGRFSEADVLLARWTRKCDVPIAENLP